MRMGDKRISLECDNVDRKADRHDGLLLLRRVLRGECMCGRWWMCTRRGAGADYSSVHHYPVCSLGILVL